MSLVCTVCVCVRLMTKKMPSVVTSRLEHHGAAASSSSHTMVWMRGQHENNNNDENENEEDDPKSVVVYVSHGILNICQPCKLLTNHHHHQEEPVWSVHQTLRSSSSSPCAIVTALDVVVNSKGQHVGLVAGFANGTAIIWWRRPNHQWEEQPLLDLVSESDSTTTTTTTAITDLSALVVLDDNDDNVNGDNVRLVLVVLGSATGVKLWIHHDKNDNKATTTKEKQSTMTTTHQLGTFATNTVQTVYVPFLQQVMILVGTAAPRYNKIHVYYMDASSSFRNNNDKTATTRIPKRAGHLVGHQDWLTSFAIQQQQQPMSLDNNNSMQQQQQQQHQMWLASASQDCKIRLWEFKTMLLPETSPSTTVDPPNDGTEFGINDIVNDNDDEEEEIDQDDDDDEEEEARLEIHHTRHGAGAGAAVTRVSLEALLIGHEEPVTSVVWHPKPQQLYSSSSSSSSSLRVLISSSMDRTLLIWTPQADDAVWTPLTRVGAAGGILGGSIGSTLLGFVGAAIEPHGGNSLVGQAYGGALHFWNLTQQEQQEETDAVIPNTNGDDDDELAVWQHTWRATPCITGHFGGVTDCCWEATSGQYLLTVSNDQTCRLWAPVPTTTTTRTKTSDNDEKNKKMVWVELARPQVHGYDLKCLTSISHNDRHLHRIVTGADEKEIRTFDAPMTTLNTLRRAVAINGTSTNPIQQQPDDGITRVDRAYIPALGLSNKASADDGAEQEEELGDKGTAAAVNAKNLLPLERDLGAVSLWPEVGKLFGHKTELYCLTSTLTARCGYPPEEEETNAQAANIVVASSAKARVEADAAIRLWDVEHGKCLQVLEVGLSLHNFSFWRSVSLSCDSQNGHKSTVATLAFSPDGDILVRGP